MIEIRTETTQDRPAIYALVASAFGQPNEADLVDRLRLDGASVLSVVAEDQGVIVGHIMLSIMSAPFRALAMAPLSVWPARQRQGIGSALVRAAIETAKDVGWQGVFVLGDQTFYARFGFDLAAAKGFASSFAGDHFALLSFDPQATATHGVVDHADAFFP